MKAVTQVFHKAQFSPEVLTALGGVYVSHIRVNQISRTMEVFLFVGDNTSENSISENSTSEFSTSEFSTSEFSTSLPGLRQELYSNFPELFAIEIYCNISNSGTSNFSTSNFSTSNNDQGPQQIQTSIPSSGSNLSGSNSSGSNSSASGTYTSGSYTSGSNTSGSNTSSSGRFRKVKINKTIPQQSRTLLSAELKAGEDICVEGIVFNLNRRILKSNSSKSNFTSSNSTNSNSTNSNPSKSERILITFDLHGRELSDRYNAVSVKLFASKNEDTLIKDNIKNNGALTVRGRVLYDDYAGELIINADTIAPGQPPEIRPDNAPEKRVELHLHTTMSEKDAVTTARAYVERAALWGHPAIAITDHGVAQAFPEAARAGRELGVKILYGVEAYFVDDFVASNDPVSKDPVSNDSVSNDSVSSNDPVSNDSVTSSVASYKKSDDAKIYKKLKYHHAVIFAANKVGLRNLYQLISDSHLNYFYKRPRILKSSFMEHRDGLLIGSACESGELFRAVREGAAEEVIEKIAEFYDYLEIQPLGNNSYMIRRDLVASQDDLINFNRKIVALGEKLNKPVIATCDVHFLDQNDEVFRRIIQSGDGFPDADKQAPLYFRTTEEMLDEFAYLGQEKAYEVVVTNSRKIADSIESLDPIPQGTFPPIVENAEEDVKVMAMDKARSVYGDPLPALVADRMDQELNSIIQNGFAGMYIIAQKLVAESMAHGYLVGSRGSVGSSLVATMMGITEVNPLPPHYYCIKCGFFQVVSEFAGGSGFDLPDKKCPECEVALKKNGHDIPFETFLGFDGDKEPDIDLNFSGEYQQQAHSHAEILLGKGQVFKSVTISTIAEKTAYGYVKKYFDSKGENKRKAEINRLVAGCTGIKRTTGQHPGGLIVVPTGKSIYEFCPVQYPANKSETGVITTHFDYHSIEGCLFKLDILGHDVPTILRMLHDFTGLDPEDSKAVPLDDKAVLGQFTKADSAGLPEFGTNFVRQMLLETKPATFSDLVRISGLSHGTNVWTNNGQDLIKEGIATLKEIIPSRDDIMVYLIHKGVEKKVAFKIMESVRKGRGVGPEDADRMEEAGVPEWYIESCRKIEYLFPKAHAVAYVLMTIRIAYFKFYHPEAFYAAAFSVKADEFDYALMCTGQEAAEAEYARLQNPEVGIAKDKSTQAILELVIEMYKRGIKFAPLDIYESEVWKFKPVEAGILPPLCTVAGLGQSVAEAIAEARKEGPFRTVESFKGRTKVNKTVLELLRKYRVLEGIPETDQLSLFD